MVRSVGVGAISPWASFADFLWRVLLKTGASAFNGQWISMEIKED